MLSPTLAPPPPSNTSVDGNSPVSSPAASRRRGLSYLRALSSRDQPASNNSTEPPRPSPRLFFTRSTSYQETKNSRDGDGRRRSQSHSRPNVPQNSSAAAASSVSLARVASDRGVQSQAETVSNPATPTAASPSASAESMTRNRPSSSHQRTTDDSTEAAPMSRTASGVAPAANGDTDPKTGLPTIRFYPHQDQNRLGRQSLNFAPVSRILPSESSIIKVGRYSEREGPPIANPTTPSDAPVGFKSKVVSRKHCEFCFIDGQWQIRDVASSSGTFLNHIRLSQPNQESRFYPIKDGDIVQLGIDFRGGEEMIFRCVKIRIECNRSWQKKPNNFNKQRQALLRGLAKDQPAANSNSGECSICLCNVLPCQALFVAPCAHVWHYKCIRPMLETRDHRYPQFQCPNCRAYSDLDADVDVDMEDWAEESADQDKDLHIDQSERPNTSSNPEIITEDALEQTPTSAEAPPPQINGPGEDTQIIDSPAVPNSQANVTSPSLLSRRNERPNPPPSSGLSPPISKIAMPTRPSESEMQSLLAQQRTQIESPNADQIIAGEGPLTPRNNAGPFVFDGSGSRTSGTRIVNLPTRSLDGISDGIE